jgi:hypothetical protein
MMVVVLVVMISLPSVMVFVTFVIGKNGAHKFSLCCCR